MAISVKSKFAGLLRGLLHRFDDGETARPAAAAAPATPAALSANLSALKNANAANTNEIELPLAPIVMALPMDLRAKLMSTLAAEAAIRLPVDSVVGQLAFGAVKISFGELRRLAPGIFANTGGELDKRPVSLPLGEILARLNPALLARRQAKKVEVAEELAGPFAGRGTGVTFTTQPLKGPVVAPVSTPPPEPVRSFAFTPLTPRQVAPPPVTPPVPPRAIIRPATNWQNGNGHSAMPMTGTPRSVTPASHGSNGSVLPTGIQFSRANDGNGHGLPTFSMKISAAPVPALTASMPPADPEPPTIFATLADLSENWPEELRNEISRSPLANANVLLAGNIIEPGLKRGRVALTWKQLRTLAQPGSAASANDNLELELPLKVIAPLFLAAKKNLQKAQPKVSVSPEIPDLFFGFPQPSALSAPVVPALPPLPKPPEQKNADTNFYVWGEKGEAPQADEAGLRRGDNPQTDFLSRQAHPKEVVLRAAQLPGVAGAVVALPDGLRVASQVPADLNADTLAAFLPQIFERVNQSTRELRMGALNNVSFTVGNVPWKIFRVNSVYFAAFGRAGEGLPSAELAKLAAEIDRKKQK